MNILILVINRNWGRVVLEFVLIQHFIIAPTK